MIRSAIKALSYMLSVLLGVSLITLAMIRLAPGDPAEIILTNRYETPAPEKIAKMRIELGLDDPLHLQYLRWLKKVLVFDLGNSYRTGDPVAKEILARMPATLMLAFASLVFVVSLSTISGITGALGRHRFGDSFNRLWTIINISIPDYWLGIILILVFSLKLGWFPVMGKSGFASFVLPVLTLGLSISAVQGRVLRAGIIETMSQDYLRFAYAKGLSFPLILVRHILKNALIPVVTMWGTTFGHLLGGAVIVENVFSWPGLGKLSVDAILGRDIPMLQGVVLFMAVSYVVSNRFVDIIYRLLDPRIGFRAYGHRDY